MYGFILVKFVKPYEQSVLFKTVSFHNTVNLSFHWLVSCNTSIIQELYQAVQIWYFYMYNLICII